VASLDKWLYNDYLFLVASK